MIFVSKKYILFFQGSNVPDEDIRYAGDKFKESLELASDGMANLLDNEVNSNLIFVVILVMLYSVELG